MTLVRFLKSLRESLTFGRPAVSKRPTRHRPEMDVLEDRTVPAKLMLSSLNLSYTASPGEANQLTVSESNGYYTFRDTGATIQVPLIGSMTGVTIIDAHTVTVSKAFVSRINVSLGDLADTVNLNSTTRALTIDAGAGADKINVGNGSLLGVQSAVTVVGGTEADTLTVSPSKYDPVTVTASGVSWRTFPGLTYSGVEGLTLSLTNDVGLYGTRPNELFIQGTAAATPVTINGSFFDYVFVGDETHSLDGIKGAVTYNGQPYGGLDTGFSAIGFMDQASTAGRSYTLTDLRSASQPTPRWSLARNGSALITFSNVCGMEMYGTSMGDTLTLKGALPSLTLPWGDFPERTNYIDLGDGVNTVVGPNTDNTWWFERTEVAAGVVADMLLVGDGFNAALKGVGKLTGGGGADHFIVTPTGRVPGMLDGGGGANALDYSRYDKGVVVNLAAGTAGDVAAPVATHAKVSNVYTVIGSEFADRLIGNGYKPSVLVGLGGNDRLFGGSARAILIGGKGEDVIQTGSTDDIIIGGWTDHDTNSWALDAIMREWARTDMPGYTQRRGHISGTDLATPRMNDAYFFNGLVGNMVHDDSAADTVISGTGDWVIPS